MCGKIKDIPQEETSQRRVKNEDELLTSLHHSCRFHKPLNTIVLMLNTVGRQSLDTSWSRGACSDLKNCLAAGMTGTEGL